MQIHNIFSEVVAHFERYPIKLNPKEFVGVDRTITIKNTETISETKGTIDVSYVKFGNDLGELKINASIVNGGLLLHTNGSREDKGSAFYLKRLSGDFIEWVSVFGD